MPRTAPPTKLEAHVVCYVRLQPHQKARLKAYADRAHEGSISAAVRWLIDHHIGQKHER